MTTLARMLAFSTHRPYGRFAVTTAAFALVSTLAACSNIDDMATRTATPVAGGGSSSSPPAGGGGTSSPPAGGGSSSPPAQSGPPPVTAPAPTPPTPPNTMPTAQPTSAGDAIRFLEQTSFGPTDATVAEIMQKGPALALEEQFAKPLSGYGTFTDIDPDPGKGCPNGSAANCVRDNYTVFPLQVSFFRNAMSASDQLRQRVAFALSQILVISGAELQTMNGVGFYQQTLMNFAFGNFRDIMNEVTLSPAMGEYLDMVNNPKPNVAQKIEPNENYARELMQLFTVGEFLLNPDGSPPVDGQGNPINTYAQDDVENLARVFTGWTYPTRPGATLKFPNPAYYLAPMALFPAQHDTDAKTLLGTAIPAGQSAQNDLKAALDIIFNHPNVGPFIGRQLIQHLVTSNPSPAYVARVTAAFNNNGQGVRGDMRTVLRAILLDSEARGDVKTAAAAVNYGKLREPALYVTGVLRTLGATSDGVALLAQATNMGQSVFQAPSVFNFYPPNYVAPGTTIAGPQFKLMLTGTILNRVNFVNQILFGGGLTGTTFSAQSTLQSLQALAGTPQQLVDRLNLIFMHNTLSSQASAAIVQAVQAYPANDPANRVRQAVYLVATSAQYQVEQ